MELPISQINEELYLQIDSLRPFGEGFAPPIFLTKDVFVKKDKKTHRNHHIMSISDQTGLDIPAIKWFGDDTNYESKTIDIIYTVEKTKFKGNYSLQLNIRHIIEKPQRFGDNKQAFHGCILDMRNKDINSIIDEFKGSIIFYEDLDSKCQIRNTINRYTLKSGPILVFLTPPPNTTIFREVVFKVSPQKLILNFSICPQYAFVPFISKLLSVIKYIILNNLGKVTEQKLSAKLCIEENLLITALEYLAMNGKICYEKDKQFIYFYRCNKQHVSLIDKRITKYLQDALSEKEAYQKCLLNLDLRSITDYLK